MKLSAKALLIKIGEAKKEAGRVFGLIDLSYPIRANPNAKSPKPKLTSVFELTAPSFAMPIGAKVATCCAATCLSKFQPRSGNTTSNSFKWRKPSRT